MQQRIWDSAFWTQENVGVSTATRRRRLLMMTSGRQLLREHKPE